MVEQYTRSEKFEDRLRLCFAIVDWKEWIVGAQWNYDNLEGSGIDKVARNSIHKVACE
jgi:hypothetical protein